MTQGYSQSDLFHLRATEGWLGLGDVVSADEELSRVDGAFAVSVEVLVLRWQIAAHKKEWQTAADVARVLTETEVDNASHWIWLGYATRRGFNVQAAFDVLAPALTKFPDEPTIPYNMACYLAQLDRIEEAKVCLANALKIDDHGELKKLAAIDPDLAPLRKPGAGPSAVNEQD
ncbi:MAG: hypothetical protein JWM04_2124 [Verrucomicrobiales bacterium]|nr:hypothetical protein [Verrucomicrobiales bacterium]